MNHEMKKIYDDFTQEMLIKFKKNLGLDEKDFDAIIFLTLFIFQTENGLNNTLVNLFKKGFDKEQTIHSQLNNEIIVDIIDELTFSSKLNIYEKIVGKYPCYDDLKKGVSFFRELNNIRNKLFHCKLNKITYKGKKITDGTTRFKMMGDFATACGAPPTT